jgi:hypothetical protein
VKLGLLETALGVESIVLSSETPKYELEGTPEVPAAVTRKAAVTRPAPFMSSPTAKDLEGFSESVSKQTHGVIQCE